MRILITLCLSILLLRSGGFYGSGVMQPLQYRYSVVQVYPHDSSAFTQGLAWDNGTVIEGTGLTGKSSLRRVELATGRVLQQIALPANIFGEGVTLFHDKIFQLTWKNKILFVWDSTNLQLLGSYPFPRQGWGLTHDNRYLIASDGSSTLYFLDPETFQETRRITVYSGASKVESLNELEYAKGRIYANIYKSDSIAIINPESGFVEGWVDLSELRKKQGIAHKEAILNGIMYDRINDKLYVTGKFWPKLYEICLLPPEES